MKKRLWNSQKTLFALEIKFDIRSLKRKVQLYSQPKKKILFCFSQPTYLFSRFLPTTSCYFDPCGQSNALT